MTTKMITCLRRYLFDCKIEILSHLKWCIYTHNHHKSYLEAKSWYKQNSFQVDFQRKPSNDLPWIKTSDICLARDYSLCNYLLPHLLVKRVARSSWWGGRLADRQGSVCSQPFIVWSIVNNDSILRRNRGL